MQKHEKRNRRRIKTTLGMAGALAGATLTGAALIGASPQRAAETAPSRVTEFPFTTLTSNQRMHLNVTNVLVDSPDTSEAREANGAEPCRVLFQLFDSEGRVVATSTSMLEAGKTAQLTIDAPDTTPGTNSLETTPAGIQGMRGEILVPEGRCKEAILGSMEIIDTSSGEVRAVIAPTRSRNVAQSLTADPPDAIDQ